MGIRKRGMEGGRERGREGRRTCDPSPASKIQVLPEARKAMQETLLLKGGREGGREGGSIREVGGRREGGREGGTYRETEGTQEAVPKKQSSRSQPG